MKHFLGVRRLFSGRRDSLAGEETSPLRGLLKCLFMVEDGIFYTVSTTVRLGNRIYRGVSVQLLLIFTIILNFTIVLIL